MFTCTSGGAKIQKLAQMLMPQQLVLYPQENKKPLWDFFFIYTITEVGIRIYQDFSTSDILELYENESCLETTDDYIFPPYHHNS